MGVEVLQALKCEGCGKFRKDIDLDLFEFVDHDRLGMHDELLCRWCHPLGFPVVSKEDS